MATIWRGSIAFGLVNVPVEAQRAVRDHRLSFRMLHESGKSPIKYKRVRDDTGEEVAWGDIVKGYEMEKDEYVILSDKDFEEAAVKQSNTIEIDEFVAPDEIDPRFYDSAYFLVPAKGGQRAYALLRDALAQTGLVGIGKIILRRRQHIAALRPDGDALVLMLLRFADELIEASEYSFPGDAATNERELRMATELVGNLQAEFDPSKYTDEYDANLRRIIEAKATGDRVRLSEPARPGRDEKVIDLMERLQQSLKETKRKAPSRPRTRRKAAKQA